MNSRDGDSARCFVEMKGVSIGFRPLWTPWPCYRTRLDLFSSLNNMSGHVLDEVASMRPHARDIVKDEVLNNIYRRLHEQRKFQTTRPM